MITKYYVEDASNNLYGIDERDMPKYKGDLLYVSLEDYEQLEAKNKRLKKVLQKYGKHYDNCYRKTRSSIEKIACSCGFEQALKG